LGLQLAVVGELAVVGAVILVSAPVIPAVPAPSTFAANVIFVLGASPLALHPGRAFDPECVAALREIVEIEQPGLGRAASRASLARGAQAIATW
jgi:hypothetical protein